jgi:hypothetical protein
LPPEESQAHRDIKAYVQIYSEELLGRRVMPSKEEFAFKSGIKRISSWKLRAGDTGLLRLRSILEERTLQGSSKPLNSKIMFAAERGLLRPQVKAALGARRIHQHIENLCRRYGVRTLAVGFIV